MFDRAVARKNHHRQKFLLAGDGVFVGRFRPGLSTMALVSKDAENREEFVLFASVACHTDLFCFGESSGVIKR